MPQSQWTDVPVPGHSSQGDRCQSFEKSNLSCAPPWRLAVISRGVAVGSATALHSRIVGPALGGRAELHPDPPLAAGAPVRGLKPQ